MLAAGSQRLSGSASRCSPTAPFSFSPPPPSAQGGTERGWGGGDLSIRIILIYSGGLWFLQAGGSETRPRPPPPSAMLRGWTRPGGGLGMPGCGRPGLPPPLHPVDVEPGNWGSATGCPHLPKALTPQLPVELGAERHQKRTQLTEGSGNFPVRSLSSGRSRLAGRFIKTS